MADYITAEEAADLIADGTTVEESELEQAQDLLDLVLQRRQGLNPTGSGRKLGDPASLTTYEREGLHKAMAAQVVYQRTVGPEHFIRDLGPIKTDTYERSYTPSLVGPEARRHLSRVGLLLTTGTAVPGHARPVTGYEFYDPIAFGWEPLY